MLLNINILQEFVQDVKVKLTGSYIAKNNNLNQKTVSKYLLKLEKEHFLKSQIDGRNKLFFLNLQNLELVTPFVIATELLRTINFYKKNPLIKEISEKIKPFIVGSAIIFGSYAKNIQKKDSDLDLLIIGKCNEKEIEKISKAYNVEISLKIYSKFEKDILMNEVLKNHIIIKQVESFVEEILNETN